MGEGVRGALVGIEFLRLTVSVDVDGEGVG
jgi:hypothetical protein